MKTGHACCGRWSSAIESSRASSESETRSGLILYEWLDGLITHCTKHVLTKNVVVLLRQVVEDEKRAAALRSLLLTVPGFMPTATGASGGNTTAEQGNHVYIVS